MLLGAQADTVRATETQKLLLRSAFFLPPPTEQNEEQKKALRDYEAAEVSAEAEGFDKAKKQIAK